MLFQELAGKAPGEVGGCPPRNTLPHTDLRHEAGDPALGSQCSVPVRRLAPPRSDPRAVVSPFAPSYVRDTPVSADERSCCGQPGPGSSRHQEHPTIRSCRRSAAHQSGRRDVVAGSPTAGMSSIRAASSTKARRHCCSSHRRCDAFFSGRSRPRLFRRRPPPGARIVKNIQSSRISLTTRVSPPYDDASTLQGNRAPRGAERGPCVQPPGFSRVFGTMTSAECVRPAGPAWVSFAVRFPSCVRLTSPSARGSDWTKSRNAAATERRVHDARLEHRERR